MIKIGILGDIGSGKSYTAQNFGYPVFDADREVAKLYQKNQNIFIKLKKILPKHIHTFPVEKKEIVNAILANHNNLDKIVKIVHREIRKKMNIFLKKHREKKIVILDIPLLLENKINKKKDILVFVQSNKSLILKRMKKRKNFNQKLFKKFKSIQLPINYKKKKSQFIVKNDFTPKSIKRSIKNILKKII
jgi:dephospho-CoA kinase